jgi:hypothetical protein
MAKAANCGQRRVPEITSETKSIPAQPSQMSPRIGERNLPSPQRWGTAQPGMSWHHIIPFPILRDVWNRLVDQHIATQLPEARTAIRQFVVLADSSLPNLDDLIDRMRIANIEQRRATHNRLRPLEVHESNRLATAATWPAWNTVEGPNRGSRSDDPGDVWLDRFTAGLTALELARMRAIEALYHNLRQFVDAGPAPGASALRSFAQTISAARPNVYCDTPMRYRPEMWEQERDGRWRKRREMYAAR